MTGEEFGSAPGATLTGSAWAPRAWLDGQWAGDSPCTHAHKPESLAQPNIRQTQECPALGFEAQRGMKSRAASWHSVSGRPGVWTQWTRARGSAPHRKLQTLAAPPSGSRALQRPQHVASGTVVSGWSPSPESQLLGGAQRRDVRPEEGCTCSSRPEARIRVTREAGQSKPPGSAGIVPKGPRRIQNLRQTLLMDRGALSGQSQGSPRNGCPCSPRSHRPDRAKVQHGFAQWTEAL